MKKIVVAVLLILLVPIAMGAYYTSESHTKYYKIGLNLATESNHNNSFIVVFNLTGTDCENDNADIAILYNNLTKKAWNFTNDNHDRVAFVADDIDFTDIKGSENEDYALYCNTTGPVTRKGRFYYLDDYDDGTTTWTSSGVGTVLVGSAWYSSPNSTRWATGGIGNMRIPLNNTQTSSMDYRSNPDPSSPTACPVQVDDNTDQAAYFFQVMPANANNMYIYDNSSTLKEYYETGMAVTGAFGHFNLQWDTINLKINLTWNNGNYTSWTNVGGSNANYILQASGASGKNCYLDDVFIGEGFFSLFNGTVTLSTSADTVSEPLPVTAPPSFINPTPPDEDHVNTQQIINMTHNGTNVNFYLYFGTSSSLTESDLVITNSSTQQYTTSMVSEGWHYFKAKVWNSTSGFFSENITQRRIYYDVINPSITLNANNFFVAANTTIVNLNKSLDVLLNLTFSDNFDVYSFELNITNSDGSHLYNVTNTTLNGTSTVWARTINISNGTDGTKKTAITVWDSHTAKSINDWNLGLEKDAATFDNQVRITCDGAESFNTLRKLDRYSFGCTYSPGYKERKAFYVESDSYLDYQGSSMYAAHFVDFKNKKWIDFEGLGKKPIVTRISDRMFKVEFDISSENIWFNSIGTLNSFTSSFEFYLDMEVNSVEWYSPTSLNIFADLANETYAVRLNVTDNSMNTTFFYLYNETPVLVNTTSYTVTGSGSYIYNHSYINLTGNVYYLNATHIDIAGNSKDSDTIRLENVNIDDCTNYTSQILNFTVLDETTRGVSSLTNATVETDVYMTTIYGTYHYYGNASNSIALCVPDGMMNHTNVTLSSITRYWALDHAIEYHYITGSTYSASTTNNYELYTINLDNTQAEYSTSYLVNFQDSFYLPVQGAVVDLLRYYVNDGEYTSVEHGMTDSDGNTRLHIVSEDVIYQIQVRKDNAILYTSPDLVAICQATPCQINLKAESAINLIENYTITPNLMYSWVIDKTTRTVQVPYYTLDGNPTNLSLYVIRYDAYMNLTACSDNSLTASGTLSCTVPQTARNMTYVAKLTQTNSPETWVIETFVDLNPDASQLFGEDGVILALLMYLCLVFMAVPSGPIATLVFGFIGLIFAGMLNIMTTGSIFSVGSSLLWVGIAIGILVYKMVGRRG